MELKKMEQSFRMFSLFGVLAVVFLLSACQGLPMMSSQPPEAVLEKRVAGLMNAKVNQDWGSFYTYLDPAFQEKVSKKNFMNRSRDVRFTDYSIQSIQIAPSGEEATVAVLYDMMAKAFHFTDQRDTQKWVKKGRKWYLEMKPAGNPMEGGGKPPASSSGPGTD